MNRRAELTIFSLSLLVLGPALGAPVGPNGPAPAPGTDWAHSFPISTAIITVGFVGLGLLALYVAALAARFLFRALKESRAARKEAAALAPPREKKEGRALLGTAFGLSCLYGAVALLFLFISALVTGEGMGQTVTEALSRALIVAGFAGLALLFLYIVFLAGVGVWNAVKFAKPAPAVAAQPPVPAMEFPIPPVTRRSFLSLLGWAWVVFAAASMGALGSILRFFFPNVTYEPPLKFLAGFPSTYAMGVDERFKASNRVWIVRNQQGFYSLSTICTHLGCTPNWLRAEQKFKCPCHGSGYYITGINFEGPAPRPLPRYNMTWADDGQIQVNKGIQYQYELGQWGLPGSFLDYKT